MLEKGEFTMNTVNDLMKHTQVSCNPETRASDIKYLMSKYNFHDLVVTDEHKSPIGIIHESVLADSLLERYPHPFDIKASECMYSITTTVFEETSLDECLFLMNKNHINIIPVVKSTGEYCGIVTKDDIISST